MVEAPIENPSIAAEKLRARAAKMAFFVLASLSVLALDFSGGYMSAEYHVDKGIDYAFNYFRDYGLVYGREIFFGYGPLTYLRTPLVGASRLLSAQILTLTIHLVLLSGLIYLGRRTRDWWRPAAILFALQLPPYGYVFTENSLVLIGILFYSEDALRKRGPLFIFPTLFAALYLYVMPSAAVSLTMLFAAYLAFVLISRKDSVLSVAFKVLFYLAAVAGIGCLCYDSVKHLIEGFRVQFMLVRGYSESWALSAPIEEVVTALLMTALLLPPAKWILETHGKRWAVYWLVLAGCSTAIAFRHGFVRADWHVNYYFSFVPVAVASSLVLLPLRKAGIVLVIALIFASQATAARFQPLNPFNRLAKANFGGIGSLIDHSSHKTETQRMNDQNLAAETLSEAELRAIGGGTVEVLPFDSQFIGFHRVAWKPNPLVQLNYVFTEEIDRWLAEYYKSGRAAEFIVLKWQNMDGRHPLFSAVRVYREILARYGFLSQTDDRFLLRKKETPMRSKTTWIRSVEARLGESVPIPPSEHMVVAEIHAEYTLLTNLMRLLFREPPAYIDLQSGEETNTFRFSPSVASGGLMVNRVPMKLEHLKGLFESGTIHSDAARFSAMTLNSPHKGPFYSPKFKIHFNELTFDAEP